MKPWTDVRVSPEMCLSMLGVLRKAWWIVNWQGLNWRRAAAVTGRFWGRRNPNTSSKSSCCLSVNWWFVADCESSVLRSSLSECIYLHIFIYVLHFLFLVVFFPPTGFSLFSPVAHQPSHSWKSHMSRLPPKHGWCHLFRVTIFQK